MIPGSRYVFTFMIFVGFLAIRFYQSEVLPFIDAMRVAMKEAE